MCALELSKDFKNADAQVFPGQSEDPSSPHYVDQFRIYGEFKYRHQNYTSDDILENVESFKKLE